MHKLLRIDRSIHNFFSRLKLSRNSRKFLLLKYSFFILGQNKNNIFIHYILWRVIVELHWKIEYSFLIAGHTKFSCDQCFGTLKSKTRKTPLWTLYDIAKTTERSSSINYAELVGSHDGEIFVQTYDWNSYFDKYSKKLKNIKSYHHFYASKHEPGVIVCKRNIDSEPISTQLLKNP